AETGPSGDPSGDARAADAPTTPPGDAGSYFPLGMNDVTVLIPLPSATATPVVLLGSETADDGSTLVPRPLFDQLVGASTPPPILATDAYDRLHLVVVRFELCDRNLPGPCATGADGRLRLVFQPVADNLGAEDAGIHTFYAIPNSEIASVVATLRDLARIQS